MTCVALAGCVSDGAAGPDAGRKLVAREFAFSVIQTAGLVRPLRFELTSGGHVDGHATLLSQTDMRHCRGELTDEEWAELGTRLDASHALDHADSAGCDIIDIPAFRISVTRSDGAAHSFVYSCPGEAEILDLFAFLERVLARIDAAGACGPDDYPPGS